MSIGTAPDPPGPSPRDPGRPFWVSVSLALALMLAVPVLAILVWREFDGLYGQDSFFYQAFATGAMRESLLRGQIVPPDFTWPPGYPFLVALLSLPLGPGSIGGQLVSLVAAASVPVTTLLLARELDRDRRLPAWVPLVAGALVALTPHLWQSAAVVMSDTTGIAFATLGAWALARYANGARGRWLVASTAALAFAIDVRSVYALVVIPLIVAGLVIAVRGERPRWADVALAATAGGLVLAPMVIPMLDAATRGEPVPFAISLQSHGWDAANAIRSTFDGPDGRFVFELTMGEFYLLEPARNWYLGPLFAVLALIGVVAVLRRPTILLVAVLIAWPVLVIGFLAGDTTQNTRFTLAALPPMAILAAIGVGWVARILPSRPWAVAAVAAVLLVGFGFQAVNAWRFTDAFVVRQQRWLAAANSLAAQVPPGDRLIAFGCTLALRHRGIPAIELYDLAPADLLAQVADGRATWLILPRDGIDGQWAAKPPGLNVAALRDGPGLVPMATAGDWSLHRVGFAAHL
jgi:hypothetical protein